MAIYEPVIGLEIHIQLKTDSKMFCSCPNQTDGTEPNKNICPVCTGQPGSLPVANEQAIKKAIMVGIALGCSIPEYSKFDRKNYFYPDLPKGYQISQFDRPLCVGGMMEFISNGETKSVRITRAHLEEDAGKLLHPAGADYSLVDLNRAGVPLLEVVTEPDFTSPADARFFLQSLRTIARYLEVSDADMEKGHLRCDANISLRPQGATGLPDYKVEIKNMNSFKAVEDALNFEIARQREVLESGHKLAKETRGWSDAKQETLSQRSKEGSDDYRYFPEPDLPVLHFTGDYTENLRRHLPELPQAKLFRFVSEYALPASVAGQLVDDKLMSEYFEGLVSELKVWLEEENMDKQAVLNKSIKEAANWCVGIFTELLNKSGIRAGASKISGENFAELIKMVEKGEVSKTAAKQVFLQMFETGEDPHVIVESKGLKQVSDTLEIERIVGRILASNPKVVGDFRSGKKQAIGFFVGKVMAETKGQANPAMVNEILLKKLG